MKTFLHKVECKKRAIPKARAISATNLHLNACRFQVIKGKLTLNILKVGHLHLLCSYLLTIFQVCYFISHISEKACRKLPDMSGTITADHNIIVRHSPME